MKIVLTAPATEMSEYNGNPAIAFASAFPKPFFLSRGFLIKNLYKPVDNYDGFEVKLAPLGLRRIESSLIESGLFREDDVVIVHPDNIEDVVNEDTKVVGVGVKDPLGLGYVSLTYSALVGFGEPINRYEFKYLISKLNKLKKRYRFRVVFGGPGVWQVYMYSNPEAMGIDVVVDGEGEYVAPQVFYRLAVGEDVSLLVKGVPVPGEMIPCIRGATVYGAIELTRGCGRGCAFCSPTMQMRRDIPLEKILRDAEVNLVKGQNKLLLVTEDVFLYGSRTPWEPNPYALKKLIDSIAELKSKDLKHVQITHLNLAAALHRRDFLKYMSMKLYEFAWLKLGRKLVLTTEVGIETGSPRLVEKYVRGKVLPYKPWEWPGVVLNSLINLEECGWIPLATIIVGLPGEEIEDSYQTLKLVESIDEQGLKTFLVPLLFVPLGNCLLRNQAFKTFNELSEVQVEVFAKCWKHNVRYWGVDYFAGYSDLQKRFLKLLTYFYGFTIAKRYWWREKVYKEVYRDLVECINKVHHLED